MVHSRREEKLMQKALELAQNGYGMVEPNPMVGCVIVKHGEVIGTGWHERYGHAHAEVQALADCREKGAEPEGAEMFVTLEPCCHTGKTGPCTEAIIKAGINRVWAAVEDPSNHGAGKGFSRLSDAGVEVKAGLCEKQARYLNRAFFKWTKTKRPWVVLKWAQSSDGFLSSLRNRWISCNASREDVHRLRRSCQGILVGIRTVIADDPLLTPRPSDGKKPTRIVLDSRLTLPLDCKLINTADSPTLVVVTLNAMIAEQLKAEAIFEAGMDILAVAQSSGKCDLNIVIEELGKREMSKLLVEGGAEVIESFIAGGHADEVRVYVSPQELGEDGRVPSKRAMQRFAEGQGLFHTEQLTFGHDKCITGLVREELY